MGRAFVIFYVLLTWLFIGVLTFSKRPVAVREPASLSKIPVEIAKGGAPTSRPEIEEYKSEAQAGEGAISGLYRFPNGTIGKLESSFERLLVFLDENSRKQDTDQSKSIWVDTLIRGIVASGPLEIFIALLTYAFGLLPAAANIESKKRPDPPDKTPNPTNFTTRPRERRKGKRNNKERRGKDRSPAAAA